MEAAIRAGVAAVGQVVVSFLSNDLIVLVFICNVVVRQRKGHRYIFFPKGNIHKI